jgi:hypothetical protein
VALSFSDDHRASLKDASDQRWSLSTGLVPQHRDPDNVADENQSLACGRGGHGDGVERDTVNDTAVVTGHRVNIHTVGQPLAIGQNGAEMRPSCWAGRFRTPLTKRAVYIRNNNRKTWDDSRCALPVAQTPGDTVPSYMADSNL